MLKCSCIVENIGVKLELFPEEIPAVGIDLVLTAKVGKY